MMTLRTDRIRFVSAKSLFVLFLITVGIACQQTSKPTTNSNTTPANSATAVKSATPEVKTDAPSPVGKEVKPATGVTLKSITPTEGTIIVGALNDLAIELPQPDPNAAKNANESGTVTVEVIVKENGEVSTFSVVGGPTSLWSAAGKAARMARFDPPLYNGKPVKIAGILTYEFTK